MINKKTSAQANCLLFCPYKDLQGVVQDTSKVGSTAWKTADNRKQHVSPLKSLREASLA